MESIANYFGGKFMKLTTNKKFNLPSPKKPKVILQKNANFLNTEQKTYKEEQYIIEKNREFEDEENSVNSNDNDNELLDLQNQDNLNDNKQNNYEINILERNNINDEIQLENNKKSLNFSQNFELEKNTKENKETSLESKKKNSYVKESEIIPTIKPNSLL